MNVSLLSFDGSVIEKGIGRWKKVSDGYLNIPPLWNDK